MRLAQAYLTIVACAALASCVPHGSSAQGKAAQATANCENGYDAQNHRGDLTEECKRNGAVGSIGSPLPSPRAPQPSSSIGPPKASGNPGAQPKPPGKAPHARNGWRNAVSPTPSPTAAPPTPLASPT